MDRFRAGWRISESANQRIKKSHATPKTMLKDFVYSSIRLFVYSSIRLFVYSSIRLFVYSSIRLFVDSFNVRSKADRN
jgi:hypothetical protein